MNKIVTLIKESLTYGFATIVSRFIGFLLMPLYTKILSPEDYGVLNVINITLMLVSLFSVLGLDSAAHVFFWDYKDQDKQKSIFSSWFWAQVIMSSIIAVSLFMLSNTLSTKLFGSIIHGDKFRIVSLILISNIIPTLVINWLRVSRRPWPTTIFTLVSGLITIGLNIWFIAILYWGIKGFFMAQLISASIMSIIGVILMHKWLNLDKFNFRLLKKMLRYSIPLIPTLFAFWILNFAGGYFLQLIKGEREVGLFQTGATFASIIMLVISSFTQAWGPFAMSIKDEADSKLLYSRVLIMYFSVSGLFAVFIGIFSEEILRIMTTPEYVAAHIVTTILVFNSIISGVNFIAALGLNITKNMKPYSFAIVIGAVFNLCFYAITIKYFGKEGCALLTLFSNIIVSIWIFKSAQKAYYIPYNFKKASYILILCVASVIIGKLIHFHGFWSTILVKSFFIFAVLTSLYFIGKRSFMQIFPRLRLTNK